ncbi:MAG: MFS transporter [Symploca sp. SIO3C6]|nr:MFS transporter [Symploca sp. SIO3C6]
MKYLSQMTSVPNFSKILVASRVSQLRFTIAGFLGLFLHGSIVALPGGILLQWQAEFGADFGIASFYNLFLLGSLLGISLTSKRRQRHPLMTLSCSAIGFALLIASALGLQGLLVAAFLLGLGDGIVTLQGNSLVGELHPKRRVAILNWANAVFGLGAITVPLLGAFLPWRVVVSLVAIIALVSAILAWASPPVQNLSLQGKKIPWRQVSIFLLIVMFYMGLESSLGTWSSTYLVYLGRDITLSATLLSLYWGCLTVGRMTLADWVGQKPAQSLSWLLFCSLVVLGLSLIPPLAILFLLFPLAGFFYGPLFATLFALVQEKCGHVALSYLLYAAYIGKTSIPAFLSLLEDPAYLAYEFIFLALVLYILSFQLNKHPQSS